MGNDEALSMTDVLDVGIMEKISAMGTDTAMPSE